MSFTWYLSAAQIADILAVQQDHPLADPNQLYNLCRSQYPQDWTNPPDDFYALQWRLEQPPPTLPPRGSIQLSSIVPNTQPVGTSFTLSANSVAGTFREGDKIQLNVSTFDATIFVSEQLLNAEIDGSLLVNPGPVAVRVIGLDSLQSNQQIFTIAATEETTS